MILNGWGSEYFNVGFKKGRGDPVVRGAIGKKYSRRARKWKHHDYGIRRDVEIEVDGAQVKGSMTDLEYLVAEAFEFT